jgi:hypothetical protein
LVGGDVRYGQTSPPVPVPMLVTMPPVGDRVDEVVDEHG